MSNVIPWYISIVIFRTLCPRRSLEPELARYERAIVITVIASCELSFFTIKSLGIVEWLDSVVHCPDLIWRQNSLSYRMAMQWNFLNIIILLVIERGDSLTIEIDCLVPKYEGIVYSHAVLLLRYWMWTINSCLYMYTRQFIPAWQTPGRKRNAVERNAIHCRSVSNSPWRIQRYRIWRYSLTIRNLMQLGIIVPYGIMDNGFSTFSYVSN